MKFWNDLNIEQKSQKCQKFRLNKEILKVRLSLIDVTSLLFSVNRIVYRSDLYSSVFVFRQKLSGFTLLDLFKPAGLSIDKISIYNNQKFM